VSGVGVPPGRRGTGDDGEAKMAAALDCVPRGGVPSMVLASVDRVSLFFSDFFLCGLSFNQRVDEKLQ
jgi:hypothetical protein